MNQDFQTSLQQWLTSMFAVAADVVTIRKPHN